jgi:putative ABC transport system substrate-binding protein
VQVWQPRRRRRVRAQPLRQPRPWGRAGAQLPRLCPSARAGLQLPERRRHLRLLLHQQGTARLLRATRTVPIVFTQTPDPVGAGFVESLARPGGNATGSTNLEYGLSGKYLELLKEMVPNVKRAAILRDATDPAGTGQWGAIQSVAPLLGLELTPIGMGDAGEIERGLSAFARITDRGLVITGSAPAAVHRDLIIALADKHRLPAVYPFKFFATAGGLSSYGPDTLDQFRRAAGYVDRMLKGERPADLPVQSPTKYELAIKLKTATALGLTVPDSLLARADEVIE